jgi:hypothetical protein
VAPRDSSPPCGSPGGLLGDGAAATAEIDGGSRPRVSDFSGTGQGAAGVLETPRMGGGSTLNRVGATALACGPRCGGDARHGRVRPGLELESGVATVWW